jgi:uncharacterized protein DUF6504
VVRRYEEPIEVREGARDDLAPGEEGVQDRGGLGGLGPDAFVWRGRLYVVRAVLDRWQERRPWWRDAREREGSDVLTDARERQVWRVEASAGRFAGVGVYDLCADRASGSGVVGGAGPGTGSQWRLLRVAD